MYKNIYGVNWGHTQSTWVYDGKKFYEILPRKKEKDVFDEEVNKFLDACPVPSAFGIEHGHDFKFAILAQRRGHDVYGIHTTYSNQLIKRILGKKHWDHQEPALAIQRGLDEYFESGGNLFRILKDYDPVLWRLRQLARDRYKAFIQSSVMPNHKWGVLQHNRNLLTEEDLAELEAELAETVKETKERLEEEKNRANKKIKSYFKKHTEHPVIKAIWWDWLESIKGAGEFGVGLVIGEVYDITRFYSLDSFRHYTQLCPIWTHNGERIQNAFDLLHDVERAERYAKGGKFRKQKNGRIKYAFFLIAQEIIYRKTTSPSVYSDFYVAECTRYEAQGRRNAKFLAWKNLAQKIGDELFRRWPR